MREYVSVVQATTFAVHILLQQLWERNTTCLALCTPSCVALLVEVKESVLIIVGLFVHGINLQAGSSCFVDADHPQQNLPQQSLEPASISLWM